MKKMRCGACGEDKVYVFSTRDLEIIVLQCCACGSDTVIRVSASLQIMMPDGSEGVMSIFPGEKERFA